MKYIFAVAILLLVVTPVVARAGQFMIGTYAYSYIAEGYQNVFLQAGLGPNSALHIDFCQDTGQTITAQYKGYWREYANGPYWFTGPVYVESGNRKGLSLTVGAGYEVLLGKRISVGAFAGAAAGAEGQRYAILNMTVGFKF